MKVPLSFVYNSSQDQRYFPFDSNLRNIIFQTLENFIYIKSDGFEYLKFINLRSYYYYIII